MNILKLAEKKLIRLFLIAALTPLQSCSNTLIGEKLENSFDTTQSPILSRNTIKAKEQNKLKAKKSRQIDDNKEKENKKDNIIKIDPISNKERLSQKTTKLRKKIIFKPQPYRIILKLSGANPSAPAETVTQALIKAGVQFEVEKIERLGEESLFKDSSLKRKEF